MEGKIGTLLFVAIGVALFSYGNNFVELNRVDSAVGEVINPANGHVFHDRKLIEERVRRAVEGVTGSDADVEIELYAFSPRIPLDAIARPDAIPSLPGVERGPGFVKVSSLACRVWWRQKVLWYKDKDVHIKRFAIVTPDRLGYSYGAPPGDSDFVADPAMVLDSSK